MAVIGFISERIKFKSKIAIFSIAISFLVMIVAIAISSGFRTEIRTAMSSLSGDIVLNPQGSSLAPEGLSLFSDSPYITKLSTIEGIKSIEPVIYRGGIVKTDDLIHGVVIKAVQNLDEIQNLKSLQDSLSLRVSIPSPLSKMLGLQIGDKMQTYFVGEKVKIRQFNIVDIYEPILASDDKLIVYADINDLQRVNEWKVNQASVIEIILEDGYKDPEIIEAMVMEVGYTAMAYGTEEDEVYASSTLAKYPQIMDWLNLIDFNVLFMLILMILVAGFNMISSLLIMLFENTSTIGLLKSLGMTNWAIVRVFLLSAAKLVLKGMLLGNLLALSFCFIQDKWHILKLDPVNYFVSYVPIDINISIVLLCDIISFILIMLILLLPSLFISKVDPAQTVRLK